MNKTVIVIIVVAVLGVGGFFAYQAMQSDDNENTATTNTPTNTSTTGQSLADIFGESANQKCEYTYASADISQEGTVYTSGTNVRGDFTMTDSEGAVNTSHIIRDSEYHYNWGTVSGQTVGTKIKLADFETTATDTNTNTTADTTTTAGLDYDYDYNFDCSAWSVDSTMFDVPTDVTFTDLAAQLEQLQNINASADQCGNCDLMTDEVLRDECRVTLGC